jgi:hypothetical protein
MMMNKITQTAYEIGQEYSARLEELAQAYEMLSGQPVKPDDGNFWNTKEVEKIETLAAFWWQIGRYSDPFYYAEEFIEENQDAEEYYEEN